MAGWLCRLAVDAIYTSHSCPIVARCLQIFSFCWGCITATFICRLLWTRLSIVAVELRQPYFLSDFRCRVPAAVAPCSCGGKRPWRWRLVLISLFLIWKRRCQGRGYLQLCSAESTLDRPLSTYLLFSWFSRQIRFKYGSAMSGFSLKELITAWCLRTVQSIVYSY